MSLAGEEPIRRRRRAISIPLYVLFVIRFTGLVAWQLQ
jgi:hypothetical protein